MLLRGQLDWSQFVQSCALTTFFALTMVAWTFALTGAPNTGFGMWAGKAAEARADATTSVARIVFNMISPIF
jgi:predicted small integral membrane protein